MTTANTLKWALCAALTVLASLAPSWHAVAQVDRATGLVGARSQSEAAVEQAAVEDESPSRAATGVGLGGAAGAATGQATPQANVHRSGVLIGQPAGADRPEAYTPAATGVGR